MFRKQRCLIAFVLGMALMWGFLTLKANFYWRTMQVLQHPTNNVTAILERHDGIDTNFRIFINGVYVYTSRDFAPINKFPFREALLWDDSTNFLIFEVAGRRLFGYDLTKNQALTNAQILRAKTSPVPVQKYRYEGEWP